jgi:putative endonuclease
MMGFLRRILSRNADAPDHLETGEWGERQAADFLSQQGYRILGRRVRVGRRGELDLVVRDDEVLVFVEVKTRKGESFGRPATAVDRRKRKALSRAAVEYLRQLRFPPAYFRFDVVEVLGAPGMAFPKIRHIQEAFHLDSHYTLPY